MGLGWEKIGKQISMISILLLSEQAGVIKGLKRFIRAEIVKIFGVQIRYFVRFFLLIKF